MDAETFYLQAHPTGAEGIARSRADDGARLVISGIGEALGNLKFAAGAGADLCTDGNVVDFHYAAVFKKSESAVGNADNDTPGGLQLRSIGIFGSGLGKCDEEQRRAEVGVTSLEVVCRSFESPHDVISLLSYTQGNGTRKARRKTLIKIDLVYGPKRIFVGAGPRRVRGDTTPPAQMR